MGWPLPLYEIALMTQRRAAQRRIDAKIALITPEPAPLAIFGPAPAAVAELLRARGIELFTSSTVREIGPGGIKLSPGDRALGPAEAVALPEMEGPAIQGLPSDERGFIPVDDHARVKGIDGVYAAGDGTNFPIKQGGIATQQADAAAAHIAHALGAASVPEAFRPVLRGKLLTGDESISMSAEIAGGGGQPGGLPGCPRWPPHKIAARYLSPLLYHGDSHAEPEPLPARSMLRCRSRRSGTRIRWRSIPTDPHPEVPAGRTVIHRGVHPSDPAFLRDERRFLERQWGVLHVMERQRDHLVHDIEQAKSLAARAGIPPARVPEREARKRLAVIGIGHQHRCDDAAGLEVARRLRLAPPGVVIAQEEGRPDSLLEAWSGADEALVIEAVSSGEPPGRSTASRPPPSLAELFDAHTPGLPAAVELARELDRLPGRLVVYGIEGESFEPGDGLTPAVQDIVANLVMDLYRELSGAS